MSVNGGINGQSSSALAPSGAISRAIGAMSENSGC